MSSPDPAASPSSSIEPTPPDVAAVDEAPVELPTASQGLLAEFWDFIVHEKAWWMTPILVVLLAMVAFILYAEASPVLPFIYAL